MKRLTYKNNYSHKHRLTLTDVTQPEGMNQNNSRTSTPVLELDTSPRPTSSILLLILCNGSETLTELDTVLNSISHICCWTLAQLYGPNHWLRRNPYTVLVGRTITLTMSIQSNFFTYSVLCLQSALMNGLDPILTHSNMDPVQPWLGPTYSVRYIANILYNYLNSFDPIHCVCWFWRLCKSERSLQVYLNLRCKSECLLLPNTNQSPSDCIK